MGTLHDLPDVAQSSRLDSEGSEIAFGFMLFVLWAFSVARVVVAAETREVFGAEASLAFVCMLALPLAAARAWFRRTRRQRPRARNRESAVVLAFRRRAQP